MGTRISIITAVYNRASTLAAAIDSVLAQRNVDIEYIIVDGNSTDSTSEIVARYGDRINRYIREEDEGIYDALNKGIAAATGDIVGFLHADDFLADPNVLAGVASEFEDETVDAAYGDLVYVGAEASDHIIRYWKSGAFRRERFRWGWMPPHPTVYLRRRCYEQFGLYRSDLKISADYELLVRMLYTHRMTTRYIERVLVCMRLGGVSNASLRNRMLANREDKLAWEVNGLKAPFGLQLMKPIRKIRQFWERPRMVEPLLSNEAGILDHES